MISEGGRDLTLSDLEVRGIASSLGRSNRQKKRRSQELLRICRQGWGLIPKRAKKSITRSETGELPKKVNHRQRTPAEAKEMIRKRRRPRKTPLWEKVSAEGG